MHNRRGMTAIEVLASTLLAALLMAALLGVMRGLKAQSRALEAMAGEEPWKQSLDAALAADLASAATYLATPTSLTLEGHGGCNAQGAPNWLPSTVQYAVIEHDKKFWLIRRQATGGATLAGDNLVLADVREIRIGGQAVDEHDQGIAVASAIRPAPVPRKWTIEFWGREPRELIYSFAHHAP